MNSQEIKTVLVEFEVITIEQHYLHHGEFSTEVVLSLFHNGDRIENLNRQTLVTFEVPDNISNIPPTTMVCIAARSQKDWYCSLEHVGCLEPTDKLAI